MIFDPPTYHIRPFLRYDVQLWGVILDPPPLPTLKFNVIIWRSFLILFLQNVPRRLTIHDEAHFEEWAGKSPAPT